MVIPIRSTSLLLCMAGMTSCAGRAGTDVCRPGLLFDSDRRGSPAVYHLADTSDDPKLLSQTERTEDFSRVPDWSPDRRQIVIHGRRGGIAGLFLIPCNGGNATHVANTSGASAPAWSPDGGRIAFVRNARVYTVDLRTSAVQAVPSLPDSSFYPAWSPDGSALAFVSKGALTWEIFVRRADGSVLQLTRAESDDTPSQGPSWSPDGKRLAFDRKQGGEFHLFVMNADGTGAVQLTRGRAIHARPAWSPDGRSIAFHGTQDRPAGTPLDDPRYFELYAISADGRQIHRLTANTNFDGHAEW